MGMHGFGRTQVSCRILSSLAAGTLWLTHNSSLSNFREYHVVFLFCSHWSVNRRVLLKIKLWLPVHLQMSVALGVRVTRSWV